MKRNTISMSCFTTHTVLLLIILLLTSIPFSVSQSYNNNANDDLKGEALVIVKNILGNATDTLSYVEVLIKNTTDQTLLSDLSFCAETFIPLVKYTLPQAIDYISKSRFGFASYSISYSMKEVNKCSKKFSGSTQSPLGDRIGVIEKLGGDAASIINQLWKPPSPPPL